MNNKNDTWTTIPETKKLPKWKTTLDIENDLLQIILSLVQDGISIINTNLEIIYTNSAMETWYHSNEISGQKCYHTFHETKTPCEVCPVLRAIESRKPEMEVILMKNKNGLGWHQIFCVPILDVKGDTIYVMEYVRDITTHKKSELTLELLEQQSQLDLELFQASREELQRHELLLLNNIKKAVDGVSLYLQEFLEPDVVQIVRNQFNFAIQNISDEESSLFQSLSDKELQIARCIRDGATSKEIADTLNISKKTVDYHRINIRKKLELDSTTSLSLFLKKHLTYCKSLY